MIDFIIDSPIINIIKLVKYFIFSFNLAKLIFKNNLNYIFINYKCQKNNIY